MPRWATIALRMKALLLGSLSRNSACSCSTLKATICVFGDLRAIGTVLRLAGSVFSSVRAATAASKAGGNGPPGRGPRAAGAPPRRSSLTSLALLLPRQLDRGDRLLAVFGFD